MTPKETIQFVSTYLYEACFSAMTELQTGLRNLMSPENYLLMALRIIKLRFENFI